MPRSLDLYLSDLLQASDDIVEFTAGLDREGYEKSSIVQAAGERKFLIIGEALAQMRIHHSETMHQFEQSRQIVAFRNVLAHEYATIDNDDVWSAIQFKLPAFREQVARLVDEGSIE
jgi:uncharacterized protein with HEPN domain